MLQLTVSESPIVIVNLAFKSPGLLNSPLYPPQIVLELLRWKQYHIFNSVLLWLKQGMVTYLKKIHLFGYYYLEW